MDYTYLIMTISEIMNQYPGKISLTSELPEVIKMIHGDYATGVVVVNEHNTVVGVISKKDLFTHSKLLYLPTFLEFFNSAQFANKSESELPYAVNHLRHAKASDIMNQSIYFAHEDTDVATAAKMLETSAQSILPVVSQDNTLVGTVTVEHILRSLSGNTLLSALSSKTDSSSLSSEVEFIYDDLRKRFAFVAQTRSHLWFTFTMTLFLFGFILGIIFIVDPVPLLELLAKNIQTIIGFIGK